MLAALLFPVFPTLIAVLVSVLLAFMAPKGKAAMAGSGCLLAFLGVGFLAIGKIIPRWGGGPPLEGSMATVGSLLMIGFGGCIIFLAFFRKSDDHSQRDDSQQT
jgi:hypothetical protein